MSAHVEFSDVGKRFRKGVRADSLRELLPDMARAALRRFRPSDSRESPSAFWALRHVSFRVEPGEVLGIIGPNGAGKSTVLRLLTGLLQPDAGIVSVRGRIGALIELAAGFHPDLTGRENVYLQGAILGLSRAEVRQRFASIVDFAEIEPFLDTPVKRYSSGMHARLGFAIAVHAEPEVLIVDEILSVGDRAFQQKAFDRLSAEVQRGIPVVMVSHQLERVASLCQRAILLAQGEVRFAGPAPECVAAYVANVHAAEAEAESGCPVQLTGIALTGDAVRGDAATSDTAGAVDPGDCVSLRISGEVQGMATLEEVTLGVRVWALPAEARVAAVHAPASTLALPAQGKFQLPIRLRAHLGAGVYRLQAVAWHNGSRREWQAGPSVTVSVTGRVNASGSVWLDPVIGPAAS